MSLAAVARATAVLWFVTLGAAAAVAAIPGAAASTRTALAFELHPRPGSLSEFMQVAASNARVLALIFLAAATARAFPRARPLLSAAVWAIATANALLVGVAVGSYCPAAIRWLPHLPLEWSALGIALSVFDATRDRALAIEVQLRVFGIVVVLLGSGAAVEVYASPQ